MLPGDEVGSGIAALTRIDNVPLKFRERTSICRMKMSNRRWNFLETFCDDDDYAAAADDNDDDEQS